MLLRVELCSFLRRYVPGYDPSEGMPVLFPDGDTVTVNRAIRKLGLPVEEVRIVTVNRNAAGFDTPLKDGDRLGLFTAAGGG